MIGQTSLFLIDGEMESILLGRYIAIKEEKKRITCDDIIAKHNAKVSDKTHFFLHPTQMQSRLPYNDVFSACRCLRFVGHTSEKSPFYSIKKKCVIQETFAFFSSCCRCCRYGSESQAKIHELTSVRRVSQWFRASERLSEGHTYGFNWLRPTGFS